MNVIDRLFGVSPQALSIRAHRFEVISANLANADTPGYKARDIEFGDALTWAQDERAQPLKSSIYHFDVGNSQYNLMYRLPHQSSLDGNTVETEQEHAAFMDNAIRYQASLNFLDGRIKSVLLALRGE
ncbi:MAG: flagellar basal body rod protein FlgB [Gammaproteobacteria bacterium]|nr:MAG: flagellar basal body rod protein FlgB [Gammaproteobacteria bacterium]RLA57988.1 MAG: flagellar basal body rod protein FlgB [Gammaproteobacteria bacterium]HDY82116.1 flagellar basal body rod protein FlgB [Halieaceae bacterium]